MGFDDKFSAAKLTTSAAITVSFWIVAVVLWRTMGNLFLLYNFLYLGTAIGIGLGLYMALPRRKKHWGRRAAQFFMGGYLLVYLGLIKRENMQIEGFFFYLMSGVIGGSLIHYLVAKIAGPLLFNRGWCGWSCWTAMVLDFLPYKRNKQGRLGGKWGYLRYLHFALSLGLVLALWFGLGYRVEENSLTGLYWLLGGNVLYYTSSIALAFILKDNRAFCKYVCPITTVLKVPARFSLLKLEGDPDKCTDCGACAKVCPMDIRIPEYIQNGQRVLSTECILCLECTNVCPKDALEATFGLDAGNRDLLKVRADDSSNRS
jgi:polyferredoxin